MDDFLKEVPALIVTLALLIMLTVLLALHIVFASDTLVSSAFTTIVAFWFLSGAFRWQPSMASTRTQAPPEPPKG